MNLSDLQNDGNSLNELLTPPENVIPGAVQEVPNQELPLDSAASAPAAVQEILKATEAKEAKRRSSFNMSTGRMSDRVAADFSDLPQETPSGVDIKISPQHDLLGADAKGQFLPEGDFAKYLKRKKSEAAQFIIEQDKIAKEKAEAEAKEKEKKESGSDDNIPEVSETEDEELDDTIIIQPNASKGSDVIDIFADEEGF